MTDKQRPTPEAILTGINGRIASGVVTLTAVQRARPDRDLIALAHD
jgi:hypothetical protein